MKTFISIFATVLALVQSPIAAPKADNVFIAMEVQSPADWGLDRVDGTVDGAYTYDFDGAGSRVYVVDTGVDSSNPDLGSRVLDGYDAFNQNLDQSDCQGHGTHVAGIIAGTTYGVAKKALIVPVRVLNCSGQGNTSTLTSGIEWILKNHPAGSMGIVNMSLGGPKDVAVNLAVSRLVDAGMVVVAAAGNSDADACSFSPASAPGVLAVGSMNSQGYRSPFSNWGDCVDIFAPGSKISSNSPGKISQISQKSGTSQAAAFVSGAIATYYGAQLVNDFTTTNQLLHELSEKNSVADSKSRISSLLNVAKLELATPIAPVVDPVADPITVDYPTDSAISAPRGFTIKYNKLRWSRPTYSGSYARVTYIVQEYSGEAWKTIGTTKNLSYSLPKGSSTDTSAYRVAAKTSVGIGPYSKSVLNSGASSANLITPIVDSTPAPGYGTEPAIGSVSIVQRGGSGSVTSDISWTTSFNFESYRVEYRIVGQDSWSLLRTTTQLYVKMIARLNIQYEVKVTGIPSDGAPVLVGVSRYIGY